MDDHADTKEVSKNRAIFESLIVISALVGLIFLFASNAPRIEEHEKIAGEVKGVRITAAIVQKEKADEGSPVVGAAIGGLVAKTPGAIAGAAIGGGSENAEVVTVHKLLGCKLFVEADNQTVVYTFSAHGYELEKYLEECSLQRRGDMVALEKKTLTSGDVEYSWRSTEGDVEAR